MWKFIIIATIIMLLTFLQGNANINRENNRVIGSNSNISNENNYSENNIESNNESDIANTTKNNTANHTQNNSVNNVPTITAKEILKQQLADKKVEYMQQLTVHDRVAKEHLIQKKQGTTTDTTTAPTTAPTIATPTDNTTQNLTQKTVVNNTANHTQNNPENNVPTLTPEKEIIILEEQLEEYANGYEKIETQLATYRDKEEQFKADKRDVARAKRAIKISKQNSERSSQEEENCNALIKIVKEREARMAAYREELPIIDKFKNKVKVITPNVTKEVDRLNARIDVLKSIINNTTNTDDSTTGTTKTNATNATNATKTTSTTGTTKTSTTNVTGRNKIQSPLEEVPENILKIYKIMGIILETIEKIIEEIINK